MELVLTRIAKRNGYTIGRLRLCASAAPLSSPEGRGSLTPDPSPVGRGEERGAINGDASKASPTGGGLEEAFCDTLEPTWRDYAHGAHKIKGRSAIPEGRYAVVISWSPKMKKWLPILLGVPMFSGVRIHAGNTAKDTEGCILVGENLKKGMVLNSNIWLHRLMERIGEAKERGEGVWITIR